MATIDLQITLHAPLFDVFKAVTDFEAYPQWQPHVSLAKVSDGAPFRVGSMVYLEKKFGMGSIFINADVTEHQRNKSLELKGVHGRFRFRRLIEFTSTGRETLIRDSMTVHTGWLYFWYTPLLTATLRQQMRHEWELLRRKLTS